MVTVCKFGGSSVATVRGIENIRTIVGEGDDRRYIVVSAIGSAYYGQIKVTDLLIRTHREIQEWKATDSNHRNPKHPSHRVTSIADFFGDDIRYTSAYMEVAKRYTDIGDSFGVEMRGLLYVTYLNILTENYLDYTVSRGEYLSGVMLALILGFDYIDGTDVMEFNDGRWDCKKSVERASMALRGIKKAVISGFYGIDGDKVKIFSRGGSDVSGAVVASAVDADLYENWTDVDGLLSANPRLVFNPPTVDCISYSLMSELAHSGASLLHPDALLPLKQKNIPCHIRNTYNREGNGTVINGKQVGNCRSVAILTDLICLKIFGDCRHMVSTICKNGLIKNCLRCFIGFDAVMLLFDKEACKLDFSDIKERTAKHGVCLLTAVHRDFDIASEILKRIKDAGITPIIGEFRTDVTAVVVREDVAIKAYGAICESLWLDNVQATR